MFIIKNTPPFQLITMPDYLIFSFFGLFSYISESGYHSRMPALTRIILSR
ncbi:hypothetical protein QEW_4187 [Clostridioides difficile CD160]|nr:hypothetical protein QEW_4187 [Clostridioides difficile CD160]